MTCLHTSLLLSPVVQKLYQWAFFLWMSAPESPFSQEPDMPCHGRSGSVKLRIEKSGPYDQTQAPGRGLWIEDHEPPFGTAAGGMRAQG